MTVRLRDAKELHEKVGNSSWETEDRECTRQSEQRLKAKYHSQSHWNKASRLRETLSVSVWACAGCLLFHKSNRGKGSQTGCWEPKNLARQSKGKTARGKMIDLCCDKAELFHITQSSNRKALLCFSRKREEKKGLAAEPKIYICWGGNGVKRGVWWSRRYAAWTVDKQRDGGDDVLHEDRASGGGTRQRGKR